MSASKIAISVLRNSAKLTVQSSSLKIIVCYRCSLLRSGSALVSDLVQLTAAQLICLYSVVNSDLGQSTVNSDLGQPTQLVNSQTVNTAGQQSTQLWIGQLSFGLVNSALDDQFRFGEFRFGDANSDLATQIQICRRKFRSGKENLAHEFQQAVTCQISQ
ncbi:hypothetical protein F511_30770 [Dorcoceras hygrometricum]|uniref:Uncharacterized protein n=1 Tax=Dorcoceras hygrometricum TaxID=472368 RepID=A0A2Z7AX07_9LAMI|nr:hypothetical protein F511_30770 [Dorcoceras hygrometricum]